MKLDSFTGFELDQALALDGYLRDREYQAELFEQLLMGFAKIMGAKVKKAPKKDIPTDNRQYTMNELLAIHGMTPGVVVERRKPDGI